MRFSTARSLSISVDYLQTRSTTQSLDRTESPTSSLKRNDTPHRSSAAESRRVAAEHAKGPAPAEAPVRRRLRSKITSSNERRSRRHRAEQRPSSEVAPRWVRPGHPPRTGADWLETRAGPKRPTAIDAISATPSFPTEPAMTADGGAAGCTTQAQHRACRCGYGTKAGAILVARPTRERPVWPGGRRT